MDLLLFPLLNCLLAKDDVERAPRVFFKKRKEEERVEDDDADDEVNVVIISEEKKGSLSCSLCASTLTIIKNFIHQLPPYLFWLVF